MEVRLNDPMCPMKKIHTIISDDNVYVNVQKTDFPVLMSFDLTDPKKWAPFFDKSRKPERYFGGGKITTCQTLPIQYADVIEDCTSLENRIQKYLIEMFQEERINELRKTTKWAITFNAKLRDILVDCETHAKLARKGSTPPEGSGFVHPGKSRNEGLQLA